MATPAPAQAGAAATELPAITKGASSRSAALKADPIQPKPTTPEPVTERTAPAPVEPDEQGPQVKNNAPSAIDTSKPNNQTPSDSHAQQEVKGDEPTLGSPVRTSFFLKHYRHTVNNLKMFLTEPIPKDLGSVECTIQNYEHMGILQYPNVWEFRISDTRIRYDGNAAVSNYPASEEKRRSSFSFSKRSEPPKRSSGGSNKADLKQNRLVMVGNNKLKNSKNTSQWSFSIADSNVRHPTVSTKGFPVLGTVEAHDFKGSSFTGYTDGKSGKKAKKAEDIRLETVHMDFQHLQGTPFRRTQVAIPLVSNGEQTVVADRAQAQSDLCQLLEKRDGNICMYLVNRMPRTDDHRRASLDFGGKLVEDWDYNLQLDFEDSTQQGQPVIQFCKHEVPRPSSKHSFDLTASYPLSLYQAFQIAACTIDNACLDF